MSCQEAYERIINFLTECSQLTEPLSFTYRVFQLDKHLTSDIENSLQVMFGLGQLIGQNLTYKVPTNKVSEALDFLERISPQVLNSYGFASTWFWLGSRFLILDPQTKQPLLGQDPNCFSGKEYEYGVALGSSALHLILENKAKVGIELCLPEADDDLLQRVVPWLQSYLPFKFSAKQWRKWVVTKKGSYRKQKIVITY
jgi:hypothetical protein